MSSSPRQRRRSAFTLLELIIAVSILMLIAVALFSFSSETTGYWSRLIVERNRFQELLDLDRSIDNILTHAVPFLWPDPDADLFKEVPFVLATPNTLRIAYLHRLNDLEEGAIRFVEIAIKDGALCATYSDRPFLYWEDAGNRVWSSVLAHDVESVSFLYADWNDDATGLWEERFLWQDEWETVESEREDIPLAIMMTLVWKDGRIESWLRRTMGNSYRERYGKWEPPKSL
ncbi:MAG: PulJ/GspJ family protein [Lentisphaeria bacterium]|jgi:hypothetical protein